MFTTLFRLKTTHLGADAPTEYYFDTLAGAEMNLHHLSNGNIDKVVIDSNYPLNYSDGCTMADLTYGFFDALIIDSKRAKTKKGAR